jgi:hypothetical protein
MKEITKLYRYNRGFIDKALGLIPFGGEIYLEEYPIIKETEQGYWIETPFRKWVSKTAKKRYAYPTPEEALNNFKIRTQSCLNHLQRQLDDAKLYLEAANRIEL